MSSSAWGNSDGENKAVTSVSESGSFPLALHSKSMPRSSLVVLPRSNPHDSNEHRISRGCLQGIPSGREQCSQ